MATAQSQGLSPSEQLAWIWSRSKFFARLLGSEWEDLAQEVWIATREHPGRYNGAFISSCLRNLAFNMLRKRKRELGLLDKMRALCELEAEEVEKRSSLEFWFQLAQIEQALLEEVATLSPAKREVVLARLAAGGDRPEGSEGKDDVNFCKAAKELRCKPVLRIIAEDLGLHGT